MSGVHLSLASKLALATFGGLLIVGVIVLIYPKLASDHPKSCIPEDEVLQAIVPADEPSEIPAMDFFDAEGQKVSLSDYKGKGVILNFWATWCLPCIRELPELDTIKKDLAPYNIEVLTASTDRGGVPVIKSFYEKIGIKNLAVLHDPKSASSRKLGIRGLPTTLIINSDGKEVARILGIHKYDSDESRAYFRQCIGHE